LSSEDPNVHPHWAAETKQLAASIDGLDYFQVLGVRTTRSWPTSRPSTTRCSAPITPTPSTSRPTRVLREAVFRIAKRVAEAYVILRDPVRRAKYAKDVSGPDRAKKLRFTDETEAEVRKEKEQELGKTPQGRQLVQKAMAAQKKGDLAGAARDLKTALLFERDNEGIKARLAEVEAELKAGKK
jgi:hypothetical protein